MKRSELPEIMTYLQTCEVPSRYLKDTDKREYHLNYENLIEEAKENSLFIYGGVGTGKTQLAIDVLTDLASLKKINVTVDSKGEIKNGVYTVTPIVNTVLNTKMFRFYNVPRLLVDIRGMFNKQADLQTLLESLSKYEYLVLDDLGVEKITDWVLETLYVLINDRYENEQKLIITSNKNIKELSESLGDRLASRIMEMCHVVELKGEDKRLK